MTVTDPILVLGATGGQGGSVGHALLHAGHRSALWPGNHVR